MEYTFADFLFKKTAELNADLENDDVRWTLAHVTHVFLGEAVNYAEYLCDSEHIELRSSGGTASICRDPNGGYSVCGDAAQWLIAKMQDIVDVKISDEQFNRATAIYYFDKINVEEGKLPWDLKERFEKVVEEEGDFALSTPTAAVIEGCRARGRAIIGSFVKKHGLDTMSEDQARSYVTDLFEKANASWKMSRTANPLDNSSE